jgi:hypothetical protein
MEAMTQSKQTADEALWVAAMAEGCRFTSPFAHTIFLECWEGKCIRLTTTAPAG